MTDEKEKKSNVADELKSLKEEMREMREMLKQKSKQETKEDINVGSDSGKRGFRIEFGDDGSQFEGVDETLGDYLSSVMEGVASNISNSMKQMTQGFQIDIDFSSEMDKVNREVKRGTREFERGVRNAERKAKRAAKQIEKQFNKSKRTVMKFQKLSEEELEKFYEQAPDLTSALSDSKKLKLLKALEEGPMYQKDLSESTDVKGGTFKHHMDSLMDVNYVQQEAVRGRYLITQLGVEALKLSEMLFRRYVFVTEKDAEERENEEREESEEIEVKVEMDEDLEEEIEEDIASSEAVAGDLQNEEEQG